MYLLTNKESVSLAYEGNIVDLWERIVVRNINIEIGSKVFIEL